MKPFPVLQIINVLMGVFMFLLDWPCPGLGGSMLHRSLEFRLAILPLAGLAAALLYQATNAAIYYVVALVVYFWAYSEGEVRLLRSTPLTAPGLTQTQIICAKPWTLPQRGRPGGSRA